MNKENIPNDWIETTLSKEIQHSGFVSDGDWVESKDQDQNGGNRLIQLADIGDGKFLNKSRRFLNDEQFSRLNCTALSQGDILVARMPDPIGRACIFEDLDDRAATVVDVAIIRIPHINNYFLCSIINSSSVRNAIEQQASGSTRTRISKKALSELKFNLPPLPEQKKIAAILSSVDTVIEKTQAQIDKLNDLKIALMQELLAKVWVMNTVIRIPNLKIPLWEGFQWGGIYQPFPSHAK